MRRHRGGDYKTWHAEVLSKAHEYNEFSVPMVESEIKSIAKSVSKWVWAKDSNAESKFIARQKYKGRRGGISKGSKNFNKKLSALILLENGMTIGNIARELSVSPSTIKNWVKK